MFAIVISIISICLAASGLGFSIAAFLRDRPRVEVMLQWDLEIIGEPMDGRNTIGIIKVINVGRRPVYVSHIHLRPTKSNKGKALIIKAGVEGTCLKEGDEPRQLPVYQEGLEEYKDNWQTMVAVAIDSAGKEWMSRPVTDRPSWAKA